jgi:hypothetical protein
MNHVQFDCRREADGFLEPRLCVARAPRSVPTARKRRNDDNDLRCVARNVRGRRLFLP